MDQFIHLLASIKKKECTLTTPHFCIENLALSEVLCDSKSIPLAMLSLPLLFMQELISEENNSTFAL